MPYYLIPVVPVGQQVGGRSPDGMDGGEPGDDEATSRSSNGMADLGGRRVMLAMIPVASASQVQASGVFRSPPVQVCPKIFS